MVAALELAPPPSVTARPYVGSEVGRLRDVLVHQPAAELARLTPRNRAELLFDDVLWPEGAAAEHRAFTEALRSFGVNVVYLEQLISTALCDPVLRRRAIDHALAPIGRGNQLSSLLGEFLESADGDLLTSLLIAGVTVGELPAARDSWLGRLSDDEFVLPPVPNQMFVRDSSIWVGNRVVFPEMSQTARAREPFHVELAYLMGLPWSPESYYTDVRPRVEGGDILVASPNVVVVGISGRSRPTAVATFAEWLLTAGIAREIVVTVLPIARAVMHLDTVATMVDFDRFLVYPGLAGDLTGYRLRLRHGRLEALEDGDLFDLLAHALKVPAVDIIKVDGDAHEIEREQWDDANNVLAVAPGVVVAYERNTKTNDRLADAGIEVVTVPGSELSRGRGGPRCMSCPLRRESAH